MKIQYILTEQEARDYCRTLEICEQLLNKLLRCIDEKEVTEDIIHYKNNVLQILIDINAEITHVLSLLNRMHEKQVLWGKEND